MLEEVFETPATCTLTLSDSAPGMPALEARMILLPLKSDLGDVSRSWVALWPGRIGRSPRRFDVTGTQVRPIWTARPVPPSHARPAVDRTCRTETQGPRVRFCRDKACVHAASPRYGCPVSAVGQIRRLI